MKAVFKHLAKKAVFSHPIKMAVFTFKQPIARTRYRTAGGINRTLPNGSIRHV